MSSTGTWSIPSMERVKYDQIFNGLQPVGGLLSGDKVKPVLLNSKLPVDVLSRVWELSDIDGDGMLDREEFTVAMHLVYRALEKNPVPAAIPPEMIPPSKRRSGASLPGAVPVLPSTLPGMLNVVPTLPENPVAGPSLPSAAMPVTTSVLLGAPTTGTLSPPIVGAVPGGIGAKWVVNPSDKLKYDDMFRQADTDMDGYLNGAEIKDIFLQSGLPQLILAHIWNLCDTAMMGKLNSDQFALAMHLVQQKLLGVEPPAQLLPEMLPPSMRGASDVGLPATTALPLDPAGMKELDILSKGIEELKLEKMKLEQEKAQKEADIKIRNGEVMSLQKELDALSHTVKQLELQKGEAQKRLDELDDKRAKLEASVAECKDKYQEEQKQMQDLRFQITNRESIVTNQEVELHRMKDELGVLRQKETDLEQQVETNQRLVDQFSKKLVEMTKEIEQTKVNVKNLQDAEKSLNSSIGQYDALLRDEITEDQLTKPKPIQFDLGALAFTTKTVASPGAASSAFGTGSFKDARQESFGATDVFPNSASGSEVDPFKNEDPFANISSDPVFQGNDPFVEGSDPFGSDPFKDEFAGDSDLERPSSGFGAAGFSNVSSSSSLKGSGLGASGGDPWGTAFPASATTSTESFDPFGTGSAMTAKPQLNPDDPFGAGSFDPMSKYSGSPHSPSQSPAAPVLPPKQKKAPAPPRPPAPKPANSFQTGFDMTDAFENPASGHTLPAPSKNNATNFATFGTPKLSSEAEQLAWAKRDSEQEYERLRRLRDQEQADLELAIALSKQESGAFKS